MYTDQELMLLRKAIYEYAAEQLMWQVLYINCVAQHAPNTDIVRDKLLSLPKTFRLIMRNSVDSPGVEKLTEAVNEGNREFVSYVDCFFNHSTDLPEHRQKLNSNVQYIAKCLNQINPMWGTAEWITLINHQIELMNTVMNNAKQGHYESWAEILPIIRKLKMDMADYLAHGISALNQQQAQE